MAVYRSLMEAQQEGAHERMRKVSGRQSARAMLMGVRS
jgi:hypothetical protein